MTDSQKYDALRRILTDALDRQLSCTKPKVAAVLELPLSATEFRNFKRLVGYPFTRIPKPE